MLATDPATGVLCKTRNDWLPDGHRMIVDLKTTRDASWEAVSKVFARYGYHVQAALYRRVYQLVTGNAAAFIHVVVESTPPHEVAFLELDPEALQAGEA